MIPPPLLISSSSTARPYPVVIGNRFTADYSEDDYDGYESERSLRSDSGVELQPRVTNNFSVPESDISDEIESEISYDDRCPDDDDDDESSVSSPIEAAGHGDKVNQVNQVNESNHSVRHFRKTDLLAERVSPSLGDEINDVDGYVSDESYYDDSSLFDDDNEVTHALRGFDEPADIIYFKPPALIEHLPEPLTRSRSPLMDSTCRDPSPSDAAMVKPPPHARLQPFGEMASESPIPEIPSVLPSYISIPPEPSRNTRAWAGHNSVLYEEVPQDSFAMSQDWPALAYKHDGGVSPANSYGLPLPMSMNYDSLSALPEAAAAPATIHSAPTLSQKRKADHMSDDDVLVPDTNLAAPVPAAQEPTINPSELNPVVMLETIESIKSPEPARKKVKKHKHDSGSRKSKKHSSFAKFAATAFAGAAVGAAGTIWGLVSLPNDWFV